MYGFAYKNIPHIISFMIWFWRFSRNGRGNCSKVLFVIAQNQYGVA